MLWNYWEHRELPGTFIYWSGFWATVSRTRKEDAVCDSQHQSAGFVIKIGYMQSANPTKCTDYFHFVLIDWEQKCAQNG